MEERVNKLLPLATKIAREFSNIPGLPHAEIELPAQEALARAARLFDPTKGDFTAYAAPAMRNALPISTTARSAITITTFTNSTCRLPTPPPLRKPVSSRFLPATGRLQITPLLLNPANASNWR